LEKIMKTKTDLHAGVCPGTWYMGTVQETSGGGFYGSLVDDNGITRFFNLGYTEFCPGSRGTFVGERVLFAPFTEGERMGKVSCLTPMTCQSGAG
jgi:hypothetical protein